jgi:hypothetical protein
MAPPVGRTLPEIRYTARPRAQSSGDLEIRWTGRGAAARDADATVGNLILAAGGDPTRVAVTAAAEQRAACVPCGTYTAAFQPLCGVGSTPLEDVTVARGAATRVVLDANTMGSIRLRVSRADGQPYRGHLPLDLELADGSAGGRTRKHLDLWTPDDRTAYVIDALAGGAYLLSINGPFVPEGALGGNASGSIGPILVRAGESTAVELRRAN